MPTRTPAPPKPADVLHRWTINDAMDLYNVSSWGDGFFSINDSGNIAVSPSATAESSIDLKELVDELVERGIGLPILLRFSDILKTRIQRINAAFQSAFTEHDFRGMYRGVYPVKVNPQRQVVEEIIDFGSPYDFGLEVGSKPELLAAIALLDSTGPLVICNGYKDSEYIDIALLANQVRGSIILVIEDYAELDRILERSRALGVRPNLGLRMKLAARGSGKWQESGGSKSKFGLTISELLRSVETLRACDMLDCLVLTHFHLGSQITNIRSIKDALSEATRLYVELHRLGAGLKYFDAGGGMAVDYDGSRSNFASSANYALEEYVADIVWALTDACNKAEVPHPTIVTECGRAIAAHHSVLVVGVLSVTELTDTQLPASLPKDAPRVLSDMLAILGRITNKSFQESYHDALDLRDEGLSLFKHGVISLEQCAMMEAMFWAISRKILVVMREQDYVPDELQRLESMLAATYVCNFSMFQSLPDCWAVDQLFPIMPIHRLCEQPTKSGILADITCDSDGKIDRFIDLRDVKTTLELHPINGQPYYLGAFLVGAYQEILGDLHNLFGDTHVVHVSIDDDGDYLIENVVSGDTTEEVLRYVQCDKESLVQRVRKSAEQAVRQKRISFNESAEFLRRYQTGLEGYTYLHE